jgi:hypothetical protein
VVGGKVVVGTEVVTVVDEPTVVGRVVLDSAFVVVECPPSVTMAVIPRAATAAMAATMITVRFRSVDPAGGSPSGTSQILRRTARSLLSSAMAGSF